MIQVEIFKFKDGTSIGMKQTVNAWLKDRDITILHTDFTNNHVDGGGLHSFELQTILIYYENNNKKVE